jgi:hypothetical protein
MNISFEIMWLRPKSKVGKMLIFYIATTNLLVGNFNPLPANVENMVSSK